jgi:hypothetical protein
MTVLTKDEDDYNDLVGEVQKIDPNAAVYMLTEAKKLDDFDYTDRLVTAFTWADTPQGWEYWDDIDTQLDYIGY